MRSLTLAITLALIPAAVAAAQPASEVATPHDTVTLKNGAMYSGELVEKVPGDHEILKLATGEVKRFEWADMVAAAVPAPAPSVPPPPQAPQVRVKLDADNPKATLEVYAGEGLVADSNGRVYSEIVGSAVCTPPCDKDVPPGKYRIAGDGILPSDWFMLAASPSSVELRAKTASWGGHQAGWILSVASLGLVGTGALEFGLAASNPRGGSTDNIVGGICLGVGAAALAIGLPLWIINFATSVSIADAAQPAERP
jgi:hypothetical protein